MSDVGKVYGRLTVTRIIEAKDNPSKRALAVVDCQCGTKGKIIPLKSVRDSTTKSCGCLRSEKAYTKRKSRKRTQGALSAKLFVRSPELDEIDEVLGSE